MSSPFQRAFSAKSPLKEKTFTMKELDAKTKKEQEESIKNSDILPQINEPEPDYESQDPQRFAGDDGYDDNGTPALQKKRKYTPPPTPEDPTSKI